RRRPRQPRTAPAARAGSRLRGGRPAWAKPAPGHPHPARQSCGKYGVPPMAPEPEEPPPYTRYRARRRLLRRDGDAPLIPRRRGAGAIAPEGEPRLRTWPAWRRLLLRRVLPGLLALVVGWVLLSLVLFLISSHFERTSPPSNLAIVLDPAGYPLTSDDTFLALGSDRRQKDSNEPHAN